MTDVPLDYVCVEPSTQAKACVIWLHGLGADGHDFADIVPVLNLAAEHDIRFVFPHAPSRPVTINANMIMPAWFDIFGLDFHSKIDKEGIIFAEKAVQQLIEKQIQDNIPANRIFLVGFSQGGALALHTALRFEKTLAGVAGLSTYLPLHEDLGHKGAQANKQLPIFLAHGKMDPVVPYWMGEQSQTALQTAGYNPTWHSYPIAHTVSIQECQDLGQWMTDILYR